MERKQDLHMLPRFDASLGYIYVEHAIIEREDHAIAVVDERGRVPIPIASTAVLMLGPGTRITHEAIKTLADNNCLVIWCGEEGVRYYAAGLGGTRDSRTLLHQARLVSDDESRLSVVRRMYLMRFSEPLDPDLTLQQIRGKEGIRVREAYASASRETGVAWKGRSYDRTNWQAGDQVNRALSAGNACLYGLAHAAILSIGMSPALGFIHTGKQLSFVYDIADLYKTDLVVRLAFRVVAEGAQKVERRMRYACRDLFHNEKLLKRIIPDIRTALDVASTDPLPLEPELPDADLDPAKPAQLWAPSVGGTNVRIGQRPDNRKKPEQAG